MKYINIIHHYYFNLDACILSILTTSICSFYYPKSVMSFAVGYVERVVYPERDPTALDSVLEALRSTTKGRLLYPEPLMVSTSTLGGGCL